MSNHLSEIVFILDRSGSMKSVSESAVAGFNSFVKEQRTGAGDARVTLVLFDDLYEVAMESQPISEVRPLTQSLYEPRGTTALLDAIGESIERLGKKLSDTPEYERPSSVIVAILTDGLENASRQYSWNDISDRIRHQTAVYKWEFLFLGANQDAIATAAGLGVAPKNTANWRADGVGVGAGSAAVSTRVMALRARAAGRPEVEFATNAEKPMNDLVKEEDKKRRGEQ